MPAFAVRASVDVDAGSAGTTASIERIAYADAGRLDGLRAPATRPRRRASASCTLALVAVAAAWVYAMFTRAPEPRREHRRRMLVYFVGLLALASVLMTRNPLFFIFAITGFFHAAAAAAAGR